MATQIEAFTFIGPGNQRRTPRYPWEQWTNGKIWETKQGIDFTPTPNAFAQACYYIAKTRGLKVHVNIIGTETVIFQFQQLQ